MSGKNTNGRRVRRLACVVTMLFLAGLFTAPSASAAERKFLVILANSPKQHGPAQQPPGGLQNPADIERAYFAKDGSGSFAEYWEEISYGDVTVAGQVTDWIELPWAIQPQGASPTAYIDLNPFDGDLFQYGTSEHFANDEAMVVSDVDGDPNGIDNGPFPVDLQPGVGDVTPNTGRPVWFPGGRFLDMDNDGRWDGLDEANNAMDWDFDGFRDLEGPWIDLDGSTDASNPNDCIYLRDGDAPLYEDTAERQGWTAVSRPDCCPLGPQPASARRPCRCPATRWTTPTGGDFIDCNGNMVPDACDISCTSSECLDTGWLEDDANAALCPQLRRSQDNLPYVSEGELTCAAGEGDNIPDECQFEEAREVFLEGGSPVQCTTETEGACATFDLCTEREPATTPRCEYNDSNNNDALDVVEPFESFVRTIQGRPLKPVFDDQGRPVADDPAARYISDNYPGDPEKIFDMTRGRKLWITIEPVDNDPQACFCSDGQACTQVFLSRCASAPEIVCQFGTSTCPGNTACPPPPDGSQPTLTCPNIEFRHVQYVSPDRWFEVGTTKMWIPPRTDLAEPESFSCRPETQTIDSVADITPQPSWLTSAWQDRYECTNCTPPWNSVIESWQPLEVNERRYFAADRGGANGLGVGWPGSLQDLQVEFRTCIMEDRFSGERILPEEQNGLTAPRIFFDGFVEHDDLPSSKYHQRGDLRLGEVTSPFSNAIYGQDLSPVLSGGDDLITAAGPLAYQVSGALNRDAGNVLNLEVLTWRTKAPFINGKAWEWQYQNTEDSRYFITTHPYAGPSGENLGFRDYNLDGVIDQGEVRPVGSENYLADEDALVTGRIPGTETRYPWNRQRMLEDCIEAIDDVIDFDDYIDVVTLDRLGGRSAPLPDQYGASSIPAAGLVSGIVLLSDESHAARDFLRAPSYFPIHNEDNDDPAAAFPNRSGPKIAWNLWFHDLVIQMSDPRSGSDFQSGYSAHEYLHTWEGYPDLYDYDIYKNQPGVVINTPVGQWDIMAGSGMVPMNLVHSLPPLKEDLSGWIRTVDLTTVLTPGVDTRITFPRSEFVRDDSHFFFENPDRLGERFYFWSVGSGFNENMPSEGLLVLHTDIGSNPDALPQLTQNGTRFNYVIVQADGLQQLENGIAPYGDAGDVWPGTTNNRTFDCDTTPASQWYALNACSGLAIRDVQLDGNGSAAVTFNWQPTNISSLSFIDPPGGTSVGGDYNIRFRAVDVFGGTTIRLYYTTDEDNVSLTNLIGTVNKTTPGFVDMSRVWDVSNLPDGSYLVFAHLIPGQGADGTERHFTQPKAGRNNAGNGTMLLDSAFVRGKVNDGTARTETWQARCLDTAGTKWLISSNVSQRIPDNGQSTAELEAAGLVATTGQAYTSVGGEVRFTIAAGGRPFEVDDTFVFITTGVTPVSAPVTVVNGQISENPIAVIKASPLSGAAPLLVTFSAFESFNPEGRALDYLWNFGDGSSATGPLVTHTFTGAQTYTVTLRATDPVSGRFGEDKVDIALANNSPNAEIQAAPLSGALPLQVAFSGAESSDAESSPNQLIYRWDFGDGNSVGGVTPGALVTTNYSYTTAGKFTAKLTVTDPGGKSDTATIDILAGNSRPVPVITHSALNGEDGHEVIFNAINSFDPDGNPFTILWNFGDGETAGPYPPTGPPGSTSGNVSHVFRLPTGQSSATFNVTAVLTDQPSIPALAASSTWPGVTVRLSQASVGTSTPFVIFTVDPDPPVAGQPFEADGSMSFDRPGGGPVASYSWNFGDGNTGTGAVVTHTYANPGTYTIALTASDSESPPNSNTARRTVTVGSSGGGGGEANLPPVAKFQVSPTTGPVSTMFSFDAGESSDPEGKALTYRWSFGDNVTATGEQVTHRYNAPGLYKVVLTVRDDRNAATDAATTVRVQEGAGNRNPVAIIGSGVRTGAVPLRIVFNASNSYDLDGDSLSYAWSITRDDAVVANLTGEVAPYIFQQTGEYQVRLTVNDGNGGVGTDGPETVVVTAQPGSGNNNGNGNDNDNGEPQPLPTPGICGLGMIPAFFLSLFTLVGVAASRRRRPAIRE